jgi:hypothetical protein
VYKIRCVNLSSGTITGFGTGISTSAGDGGTIGNGSFHQPEGVIFVQRTIPPNGVAYDLYIADLVDNIVRRVAGDTGIITTVAGPAAPSNLTTTAAGSNQINLAWTASATSGVTYDVYESTTSGFAPSAATRLPAA